MPHSIFKKLNIEKKVKDTQPSPVSSQWPYALTLPQSSTNSVLLLKFTFDCIVGHIYHNFVNCVLCKFFINLY